MDNKIYLLMSEAFRPQGICTDLHEAWHGDLALEPHFIGEDGYVAESLMYAVDLDTGAWYKTPDGSGAIWEEQPYGSDFDSPQAVLTMKLIARTQAWSTMQDALEDRPVTDPEIYRMLDHHWGAAWLAVRRARVYDDSAETYYTREYLDENGNYRMSCMIQMAHMMVSPWLAAGVSIA